MSWTKFASLNNTLSNTCLPSTSLQHPLQHFSTTLFSNTSLQHSPPPCATTLKWHKFWLRWHSLRLSIGLFLLAVFLTSILASSADITSDIVLDLKYILYDVLFTSWPDWSWLIFQLKPFLGILAGLIDIKPYVVTDISNNIKADVTCIWHILTPRWCLASPRIGTLAAARYMCFLHKGSTLQCLLRSLVR